MTVDFISYAYSASVAIGGIIGYIKAGSVSSLIAGFVFGVILTFGAYQSSHDPNNCYLTLGASIVLGGIMGSRFLNSGKFMPAGFIMSLREFHMNFSIIDYFLQRYQDANNDHSF